MHSNLPASWVEAAGARGAGGGRHAAEMKKRRDQARTIVKDDVLYMIGYVV